MRKYQYMFPQFTFYDRTGIRRILEAKAQKGWLLDKVTGFAWRFRRIAPQNIHFAVTYFPAASQFDPGPGEDQKELFAFCAHSGWVLAGTTAQIQIFYNEAAHPVPIETDPILELENIHRSAKKSFLPSYGLLLALAVMQIGLQISQIHRFPLQYLSAETTLFSLLCQIVLLLITSQELLGYALWYRRAVKKAENGEFLETKGHRATQLVFLWCLIASLILLLISIKPQTSVAMLACLAVFFAIFGVICCATAFMKRQGASAGTNRRITIVLTVALSFGVTLIIGSMLLRVVRSPVWEEKRVAATTQVHGITFEIYGDEIPLKVEDLVQAASPEYSYEAETQRSPILRREEYRQRIWGPSDLPELHYLIYTTRIPAVYELCVRESIAPRYMGKEDAYRMTDPTPWGAAAAYRQDRDGQPGKVYLLCYENRVVILDPSWDLTESQMTRVGEILAHQ